MTKKSFPASTKQISFLRSLLAARPAYAERLGDWESLGLTTATASALIDRVKASPREVAPAAKAPKPTEMGIYLDRATSTVFRVRPSKSTGNLYGERLVPATESGRKGSFVYEAGLLYKIDPAWLLSLEEARGAGREFGFCVRCGALLEDPKSVANGLGPWCIKVWAKEEAAKASPAPVAPCDEEEPPLPSSYEDEPHTRWANIAVEREESFTS